MLQRVEDLIKKDKSIFMFSKKRVSSKSQKRKSASKQKSFNKNTKKVKYSDKCHYYNKKGL